MKKLNLKPAKKGLKIPNPKTGSFLKESGEKVEMTKYWIRLKVSGQVIEAKAELKKKKEIKKQIKTEKGE